MFVVLTDSRSGSHLLQTLLDSHPQLRCYGEILGLNRREKDFYKLSRLQGCLVDYPNLLEHSSYSRGNDIPRILSMIKSCPVIHLTRDHEERAKSALFYGKAKKLDNRVRAVMTTKMPVPASLDMHDPKLIELTVYNHVQRQAACLALFSEQDKSRWLEITYEWLCGNRHIGKLPLEKSRVLCDYLGVDPVQLKTKLRKMRDFTDDRSS